MERILKYFQNLSDVQQQQFAELYDLYTDWNAKINVVSRKDIEELYLRHVLHSLGIAKVLDFKNSEFIHIILKYRLNLTKLRITFVGVRFHSMCG